MLRWEDFLRQCESFLDMSSKLDDGWTMEWVKYEPGFGYLKKTMRSAYRNAVSELSLNTDTFDNESSDDKTAVCIESINEVVTREFHVLYSESYGVPVLYTSAYTSSGRTLTLDEMWDGVPNIYQAVLGAKRWEMLTPQEHPLRGRPFYCLHPCQTENLMKHFHQKNSSPTINYLITWLSTVGPVVGLELDLKYAMCTSFGLPLD